MSDKITAPPPIYVATATARANSSPCQKSKRAAVIFDPAALANDQGHLPPPIGTGFNGMPGIAECDGSAACRRDCAKICEHAEARAIHQALLRVGIFQSVRGVPALAGVEMVHVKTVDGRLVPSGAPSCWQCSKTIVDVGLEAVWLYEDRELDGTSMPAWFRYTANAFHDATLKHEKLHPYDVEHHDVRISIENGQAVDMECSCGFKPKDGDELEAHAKATIQVTP